MGIDSSCYELFPNCVNELNFGMSISEDKKSSENAECVVPILLFQSPSYATCGSVNPRFVESEVVTGNGPLAIFIEPRKDLKTNQSFRDLSGQLSEIQCQLMILGANKEGL